jgi:hypothetical protein
MPQLAQVGRFLLRCVLNSFTHRSASGSDANQMPKEGKELSDVDQEEILGTGPADA